MVITTLAAAIAGEIGWFLTRAWGLSSPIALVVFCGGVNVASSWCSYGVCTVVRARRRDYFSQAALGGSAIRMFLAAGATLGAMAVGSWATTALTLWMVSFYVVLLAVETTAIVMLHRPTAASP